MKAPIDITQESRRLGETGVRAFRIGLAVAALGLAGTVIAALLPGGLHRLAWSYLVNYSFVLTLALGALFFVLVNHLTHAGWSVVVRRLAEACAANLPVLALFALPLLFGAGVLYPWTRPEVLQSDPVVANKTPYLNLPFFITRLAIYFLVWGGLGRWFFRESVRQDENADPAGTLRMERLAAPGTVLFAITVTFASFDLLMSLDPRWFSTIFGVYIYSGSFLSFLALLAIVTLAVQRSGHLKHAITVEHYHDIGKFMLAFVVFWAYMAFSQYLLIWYANLPEETTWFARRQTGSWAALGIVLLVGHFFVPFFGLLSRRPKRRPNVLARWAAWILVMHWIDLYWVVMPEMGGAAGEIPFQLGDIAVLLLLGGIFVALTARRLSACSLIAEGDPRLVESLTFENV